jgi:aspartyl protease family protein
MAAMTEAARRAAWLIVALAFAAPTVLPAAGQGLRDLVRALAAEHGFVIEGLALIPNEPVGAQGGDLRYRLKRLLGGYNYLVIDNDRGDIKRLVILPSGEAGDLPAVGLPSVDLAQSNGRHIVSTRRRGMHQMVDGVLVGPGLARRSVAMIVDTGASTIVLPYSMIQSLGFQADGLRDNWVQTANGVVRAKTGILSSAEVGSVVVENVAVTFIEDKRLNGNLLLGMSFLQRFRITIDDENNHLILTND